MTTESTAASGALRAQNTASALPGVHEPEGASLHSVPAAPAARITRNQRDSHQRRSLAIADLSGVCVGYLFAGLAFNEASTTAGRVALLVSSLPLWVLMNKLLGLYDRDASVIYKSTLDELPRIMQSVLLGSALLYLLWPLVPGLELGRQQVLLFALITMVTTPLLRVFARRTSAMTLPPERCLIVGSGPVARDVAEKVHDVSEHGVEMVGFIDEAWRSTTPNGEDVNLLGDVHELEQLCSQLSVDRVVIAFTTVSHEDLLNVVSSATRMDIKVSIVPRLFEGVGQAFEIDHAQGLTLHGLRGLHRTRSSLRLKRGMDVTAAGLGLLALSPMLAVVSILIKLTSPGPVLFVQWRIGRDDTPFRMFKFRTMQVGADRMKSELAHLNEATGPMFKIADDPRITRVGRFLRRFSIDEIPQLLNVLKGEMSLVGPRPLVPSEADAVIGRHRKRLELTPGLTGPWQVMGRTAVPFHEMVRLDYLFVSEWSLWNDVKLILRTLPVVLRGSGQ
jgi:exopolysaccharide biosynthesis polyprenyl glycosylphosphotransferase